MGQGSFLMTEKAMANEAVAKAENQIMADLNQDSVVNNDVLRAISVSVMQALKAAKLSDQSMKDGQPTSSGMDVPILSLTGSQVNETRQNDENQKPVMN